MDPEEGQIEGEIWSMYAHRASLKFVWTKRQAKPLRPWQPKALYCRMIRTPCSAVLWKMNRAQRLTSVAKQKQRGGVCNNTRSDKQACMYGTMDQKNNFNGHNLDRLKKWAKWVLGRPVPETDKKQYRHQFTAVRTGRKGQISDAL